MRYCFSVVLAFALVVVAHANADERLAVDATINGRPVRLAFDTGASAFVLFRPAAEKLGLKITEPSADVHLEPGQVPIAETENCTVAIGAETFQTELGVIDVPNFILTSNEVMGLIGWPSFRSNIFSIDAENGILHPMEKVPKQAARWMKLRLQPDSDFLHLEIAGEDGSKMIVAVDTGDSGGVKLSPSRWEAWKQEHRNQPMTLDSYWSPKPGMVISEESWAKLLSLGKLVIKDVPVAAADSGAVLLGGSNYVANFGLAALKRLDVIVDGPGGIVYVNAKKSSPSPYAHNRAGAVFVPKVITDNDLVAHVVRSGPAYEAGIRDGDVVLRVNGQEFTDWKTNTQPGPSTLARQLPAGEKITLSLRRGTNTFDATITLREILRP